MAIAIETLTTFEITMNHLNCNNLHLLRALVGERDCVLPVHSTSAVAAARLAREPSGIYTLSPPLIFSIIEKMLYIAILFIL